MRKGQVTLFIILGIVILLTVALVVYFTAEETKAPARKYVTVPEDIAPVYDYVSECLLQVSTDGLNIMGAQGGFINVPGIIQNTPAAYIPADAFGIVKTPLWYFDGEDRTPDLDFMASELAKYIRVRLPLCISNFSALEPEYSVAAKRMLPVVTFANDAVIVELDWPMQVSTIERTTGIDSFVVELPVRFKQLWLLADSIMRAENRQSWFENLTIDLYSADPKIPVGGMEFKCGASKWNLRLLKDRFSKVLSQNIPRVRVANTDYPAADADEGVYELLRRDSKNIRQRLASGARPEWPVAPADAFEFNRMMFRTGFPDTDLKVGFYFLPDWDLMFVGKPNDGGVLSSSQMKGAPQFLRFLCVNTWHFTYDIVYPVKVILRDDSAFDRSGFLFQFGFPVVVKNNAPARDVFSVRKFKDATVYPDFCTDFGDEVVDVRALGFVEGSAVAVELDDVNITYRCLNIECSLGSTRSDGSGHWRLYTFLPRGCSNPLLVASKPGYISSRSYVKQGVTEIQLAKLAQMKVGLRVHPYLADAKQWFSASGLPDYMHATISVSPRGYVYDQFVDYARGNDSIELVYGDANYDVDILLMDGSDVVGGYHAENLSIPYEEFAGKDEIVFNVVEFRPNPSTSDDRLRMFAYLYEGGEVEGLPYYDVLKPRFK